MSEGPHQEKPYRKRSREELAAEEQRVKDRIKTVLSKYRELDEQRAREKDPGTMGLLKRAARKVRTALILLLVGGTVTVTTFPKETIEAIVALEEFLANGDVGSDDAWTDYDDDYYYYEDYYYPEPPKGSE